MIWNCRLPGFGRLPFVAAKTENVTDVLSLFSLLCTSTSCALQLSLLIFFFYSDYM